MLFPLLEGSIRIISDVMGREDRMAREELERAIQAQRDREARAERAEERQNRLDIARADGTIGYTLKLADGRTAIVSKNNTIMGIID